jgi:hypothetical protein
MEQFDFQFYPTLLNEYHRYLSNPDEDAKQNLLNRINRVPISDPALLAKFKKGISFETAVLKNESGEFKLELINEASALLPTKRKAQQFLSFQHKNIRFYGYADVVGESRVIDLKSTSNHKPGRHDFNFQNLYLYTLIDAGFKSMDYIICDFVNIYVESYHIEDYDFESMLKEMESFRDFLIENQADITDKKIMKKRIKGLFD